MTYCKDRFDRLDESVAKILENQTKHEVRISLVEQVKKPGLFTALLMALGFLVKK